MNWSDPLATEVPVWAVLVALLGALAVYLGMEFRRAKPKPRVTMFAGEVIQRRPRPHDWIVCRDCGHEFDVDHAVSPIFRRHPHTCDICGGRHHFVKEGAVA